MLNKWGFVGVAGLAMLVAVDIASAQDQQRQRGRGGFGFGTRGGIVTLAGNEAVQKELAIDSAAKEKIAAVVEKFSNESREQMQAAGGGDFQNLSGEQRQKIMEKFAEIGRATTAKYAPSLKEILKPEQFTRLQQISWQAAGSNAFSDDSLAKELAITKEQQDKIAAINREYQDKQREAMQGAFGGGGGNFQEAMAKARELTTQRDKLAGEVLSKEQQDKFSKLKGSPFDLTQLQPAGGGPGKRKRDNNN